MRFNINREELLRPLQVVNGAVERRQTLPILGNVLISARGSGLTLTATDMELELVARTPLAGVEEGEITVPARKITDICRALPAEASLEFVVEDGRAVIRSGRSRFSLATLPAGDFPSLEGVSEVGSVSVSGERLKRLLDRTQFAMAQQDVRYYLNGLLLEVGQGQLRAVATDGHRLAVCEMEVGSEVPEDAQQIIVPRKGVLELARLLGDGPDQEVRMGIGGQSIRVVAGDVRLSSKLIDGRFPDYGRVVPDPGRSQKMIVAEREGLRQGLSRASILANDKYRAVRLNVTEDLLRILAHNPEQEEAEEEVEVAYKGEAVEVGFNVSYLIEALGAIGSERVRIELTDESSSCLIRGEGEEECRYVVMPMRL